MFETFKLHSEAFGKSWNFTLPEQHSGHIGLVIQRARLRGLMTVCNAHWMNPDYMLLLIGLAGNQKTEIPLLSWTNLENTHQSHVFLLNRPWRCSRAQSDQVLPSLSSDFKVHSTDTWSAEEPRTWLFACLHCYDSFTWCHLMTSDGRMHIVTYRNVQALSFWASSSCTQNLHVLLIFLYQTAFQYTLRDHIDCIVKIQAPSCFSTFEQQLSFETVLQDSCEPFKIHIRRVVSAGFFKSRSKPWWSPQTREDQTYFFERFHLYCL